MIAGKKILFIGPVFYHYHTTIINELEQMGAQVSFFPEYADSIKIRLYRKFSPNRYIRAQHSYYQEILQKVNLNSFDYLFVIKGELLTEEFVAKVKQKCPRIITILYAWDSAKRFDYTHLIPVFDRVYTFDRQDAETLSLAYKPLFFTKEVGAIGNAIGLKTIDFLIIGVYLPERYSGLKCLMQIAKENNYTMFYRLLITKTQLLINLFSKERLSKDVWSFKPINYDQILALYKDSRIIVDFSNVHQTGLSMRVIEALGSGNKLITTNRSIAKENFYDARCIHIIDIADIQIPKTFVSEPSYERLKIDHLRVDKWLTSFFDASADAKQKVSS